MYKWYKSILVVLIVTSLYVILAIVTKSEIVEGVDNNIDISEYDFNENVLKLDGNWTFYWNQLLEHNDLNSVDEKRMINVPSTWNGYDDTIDGKGYATYVKYVIPNTKYSSLSLKVPHMSTSYRIFINERLIGEAGVISENIDEVKGAYKRQILTFEQPVEGYNIIVQIANKDYARGGFWYSIYLGETVDIQDFHTRRIVVESILLGTLLIMGIYHLYIYINRSKSKPSLYLSLMFIIGFIRVGVTGENIMYTFMKNQNYNILVRFEYLGIILGPFFFVMFVIHFYKQYKIKKLSYAIHVITGIEIISLLLPMKVFTGYIYFYEGIAITIFLHGLYIIVKALKNNLSNSKRILESIILFVLTFVIDSLFHSNILNVIDLPIITIFGFYITYIQSVALASEYQLEDEKEKKLIDYKMEFLQAQIRPHFIQNTLNSSIALIDIDPIKAEEVLLDLSDYLKNSLHFIDEKMLIPIEDEINHIKYFTNIEKVRFGERLTVNFDYDNTYFEIPSLLIQPLVENAIIHNIEKYNKPLDVEIKIKSTSSYHYVLVKDNGMGFDINDIVFGIGIKNVKQRLKDLFNEELNIFSEVGKGSKLSFKIPVE